MKLKKFLISILAALLTTTMLVACSNFGPIVKHTPGTTYGEILVSAPRVSSRQRLVEDRLDQDTWLRGRLSKGDDIVDFGLQGKADIRSAVALYLGASVNLDPLGVKLFQDSQQKQINDLQRADQLNALNQQKQTTDLQRSDQIAALRADIEIARLKLLRDQAQSATDPSKITSPYTDSAIQTPNTPSNIQRPGSDASKLADTSKIDERLKELAGRTTPSNAPTATTAQSSPIDDFRDRLAYREEIRNEIIQNFLDDRHDVAGNSLYRLSFDTTILPTNDTSAWAVIGVCIQRPATGSQPSRCADISQSGGRRLLLDNNDKAILEAQVTQRWRDELASRFAEIGQLKEHPANSDWRKLVKGTRHVIAGAFAAVDQIQSPIDVNSYINLPASFSGYFLGSRAGALPRGLDTDSAPFAELSKLCSKVNNYKKKELQLAHGTATINNPFLISACKESPLSQKNVLKGLAEIGIAQDYVEKLNAVIPGSITKDQPSAAIIFDENYLVKVAPAVLERISDPRKQIEIYAYGGTPKETVQRISDVASRSQALEIALALQALAGKADMAGLLGFSKRNDGFFQALKRQPLVVGFGHSNALANNLKTVDSVGYADFGWIMGPRFTIADDGSRSQFRHAVVQQGLSAVISVPSWWEEVELVVERRWVKEISGYAVTEEPVKREALKYRIRLPATPSGILALLRPEPEIQPIELRTDVPSWTVTLGQGANLAIRGRDLWRNPKVMLGGQIADAVSVLPDMAGLIANFKSVQRVGGGPAQTPDEIPAGAAPVSIATSEGWKVVGYANVVDPVAKDKPAVQGASMAGIAIRGEKNLIKLGQALNGYFSLATSYREAGTSKQFSQLQNNVGWANAQSLNFSGNYDSPPIGSKSPSDKSTAKPAAGKPERKVKEISVKAPDDGESMELRIHIVAKEGDEPQILTVAQPVYYFSKKEAIQISSTAGPIQAKKGEPSTATVRLNFAPGFTNVYPNQDGFYRFDSKDDSDVPVKLSAEGLSCKIPDAKLKPENGFTCDIKFSWPDGAPSPTVKLSMVGVPEGWFDPSPAKISKFPTPTTKIGSENNKKSTAKKEN